MNEYTLMRFMTQATPIGLVLGSLLVLAACSKPTAKSETGDQTNSIQTKAGVSKKSKPNAAGIEMVKIKAGSFVMAGCEVVGCPKVTHLQRLTNRKTVCLIKMIAKVGQMKSLIKSHSQTIFT